VVSVAPADQERFIELMATSEVEFSLLGTVTDGYLHVDEQLFGHVTDIKMVYDNVLHNILGE
jgi:phosphoribosylformylglycinamidine (FGAM) synthase-like enzyme